MISQFLSLIFGKIPNSAKVHILKKLHFIQNLPKHNISKFWTCT